MASLFSEGECLYATLGVTKDATEASINKAYKKKALLCHPDRTKGRENEKELEELFKKVGFSYSILKDEDKKRIYDKTGEYEGGVADDSNLNAMMRALFKEVTEEQVESFFETYVGSEEELGDIISAYKKSKGDFKKIRDQVNYNDSHQSEEDRLVSVIEQQISLGNLKSTPQWEKTKVTEEVKNTAAYKKRWARRHREAEEANVMKKKRNKSKGTKEGDLALAMKDILQNGGFDDIVSKLTAKYASKDGNNDDCQVPDIDEDKFQAAKKRLASKVCFILNLLFYFEFVISNQPQRSSKKDNSDSEEPAPVKTKKKIVKRVVKRAKRAV